MMVSIYKNFGNKLGDVHIASILTDIKSGRYESEVNSIRYALHKGDKKKADEIKSGLIGFTASGTYGISRTKANINTYSQIVCLDFDHIPVTELKTLTRNINDCKYSFASFISPSGEGLKVFIKVNSIAEQHTNAYNQIANFYKELSAYDFDPKCKDITRLCFVSYDEDLFINENATIFEVKEEEKATNIPDEKLVANNLLTNDLLFKCLKFTEQKERYQIGNRNNFVHLFASNANRFGICKADAIDFCTTNFDLDEKEIKHPSTVLTKIKVQTLQSLQSLQTCKLIMQCKKTYQVIQ